MPVTLDAASATVGGAAVSLTMALTVASTSKILLAFAGNDNTRSISAMAWNGTALTRITGVAAASGRVLELWALTAPAAGSFNLVSNWTGAGSLGLIGMSYNGVKAVAGLGTSVATSAASAATAIFSISSTSTDIVVGFFAQNTGANTISFNSGTSRKSAIPSATTLQIVAADITGAATVSFSATATGASAWGFIGVPLVFSAAAATTVAPTLTLLGVGA